MIIKLNGEISLSKLPEVVKEVVKDIQQRAGIETARYKLKDVEIGVMFNVNGEKQFIMIEHNGTPEMFKVNVQLDDKGNIKKAKDNEKESFLDDYTKALTNGEELPCTEPIESVFNDDDLETVNAVDCGDISYTEYKHNGTGQKVVRYFRNGVLVGEMALETDKETKKEGN